MNLRTMWKKLDLTADWQVRCPKCGRNRDVRELGGFRYATRSAGIGKRTLGWCRGCRGMRLLVIEPRDAHAAD